MLKKEKLIVIKELQQINEEMRKIAGCGVLVHNPNTNSGVEARGMRVKGPAWSTQRDLIPNRKKKLESCVTRKTWKWLIKLPGEIVMRNSIFS